MGQMTIRSADDLVERVRKAAAASGRSMNEFVVAVLDAATDPEHAPTELHEIRERLDRAGILARTEPRRRPPPDPEAVAAARRRAAGGTPLSQIVSDGR